MEFAWGTSNSDIQNILCELDDLQLIAPKSESIVDQIHCHLLKIDQDFREERRSSTLNYKSLLQIFKEKFTKAIEQVVLREGFDNVYIKSGEDYSLGFLNKLSNVYPFILDVLPVLSTTQELEVRLEENKIIFSTVIRDFESIREQKQQVKALTRKLLEHSVLLTYRLDGANHLHLVFDFAAQEEFRIIHRIRPQIGCTFPSILGGYILTADDAGQLGKHICIEITDRLTLNFHSTVSEGNMKEMVKGESICVYHFPFLFQPVSLIIPSRGKLMKNEESLLKASIATGLQSHEITIGHIDLFSFFRD